MFEFYQLRSHKIHRFEPKISIREERGHFLIKTVSTQEELVAALRLRYQVFHREMIGKTKPTGLDVDRFDFHCDHLIITDTRSNEIIGTYRLNCSKFSDDFYSEQEFHIGALLDHPGIKLELGRSCIHKDYRNGAVISLLWRGIAEYMVLSESNLLFGCASIKYDAEFRCVDFLTILPRENLNSLIWKKFGQSSSGSIVNQ